MKLVMVDMKKAIAKCSHEDAPELSLPPYRSAYRFTNTMINKGNEYEHINDTSTRDMHCLPRLLQSSIRQTPFLASHLSTSSALQAKIAVVLSGCGVYDGSEIHETAAAMAALTRGGAEA